MRKGNYRKTEYVRFERFNEVLPGAEGFMDIDGMLEKNGYFLFLEWKSLLEEVPLGQRIALERLARQPRTTVIIVHGDRDGSEVYAYENLSDLTQGKVEIDLAGFQQKVLNWRNNAASRR